MLSLVNLNSNCTPKLSVPLYSYGIPDKHPSTYLRLPPRIPRRDSFHYEQYQPLRCFFITLPTLIVLVTVVPPRPPLAEPFFCGVTVRVLDASSSSSFALFLFLICVLSSHMRLSTVRSVCNFLCLYKKALLARLKPPCATKS
jgi:hypothetical protein